MQEVEEQLTFTLKQLAREELLSEEQHLELAEALQRRYVFFTSHQKHQGQGLKFLPRKLNDLMKSLQVLLEVLAETGKTEVRNKVAAVLNELRRHYCISLERYTTIKEDINML